MAIRAVVSGTGSMGREVLAGLERDADFEPVGVLEKFSSEKTIGLAGGGTVPLSADPPALLDALRPDVVIDFTNAEWTPLVARAALERGVRLVIGTTGLPDAWVDGLAKECKE